MSVISSIFFGDRFAGAVPGWRFDADQDRCIAGLGGLHRGGVFKNVGQGIRGRRDRLW